MIQTYRKIIDFENLVTDRIKQENNTLDKIKNVLSQEKDFIIIGLIDYLKKELDIDYFYYEAHDRNGNKGDLLIKKDSTFFNNYIKGKELLDFNVEELIDKNLFENYDDIIIIDLYSSDYFINLKYVCTTLDYPELSYSDKLKECLAEYLNQILTKTYNETK